MKFFRTIKAKMLIMTFICLIIGLALTNNLIYYKGSQLTIHEAIQRSEQISLKLTNHIAGIFTESYYDLSHIETFLSVNNDVIDNQSSKINQYFAKILNKNKYYYGLWVHFFDQNKSSFIIQKNGEQIALKSLDQQLFNQPESIFSQAKNKQTVYLFNSYQRKDAQGLNLITLSTPIKNATGQIVGVMGIDYKSELFNLEINSHKPSDKGYVTLFTNDATYVTYPEAWKIGKQLNDAGRNRLPVNVLQAITQSIQQGKPHKYYDTENSINFSFAPINLEIDNVKLQNPWSLAVVIPLNETTSKLVDLSYYSFAINTVLIVILSGFTLLIFNKLINRPIRKVCRVAQEIANGNLDSTLNAKYQDEMGQLIEAISKMQSQLKDSHVQKEKMIKDILRLKAVLDHATANTMVADETGFIVYMNKTAQRMFKNAENDIRKEMPHFNADQIIGSHFDKFHKNPAHQRKLVGELKKEVAAGFNIGGRTMKFNGFPVFDDHGNRVGTAVEWFDRTEQIKIESHTQDIIAEVLKGNLKGRLPAKENYTDPLLGQLAESINSLLDVLYNELSHISTSIQHMTVAVSETTRNAQHANHNMDDISHITEQVHQKAKILTDNMHQISNSSQQISQIIDVMDNITLKTNMLALNASVEASRAGESGRGFMVVADEVRKLAQHAGDATNSIRDLIKKSNEQIKQGNHLMEETLHIVTKIMESVHSITSLMHCISTSSISQEKDINEINDAIQKISHD